MCKIKGIPIPSCYGDGIKRQLSAKAGNDALKDLLEEGEEDEDEEVVSAIRRSTEERRRRKAMYMPYDFSWKFPPATEKLFMASSKPEDGLSFSPAPAAEIMSVAPGSKEYAVHKERSADDEEDDDFHSALSHLSDPPSSNATIASVMKSFTESCRWLESDGKHMAETWKKQQLLLIQELLDCEGWPFGLMRKAMLLPPLPSSPSDSWSWAKTHKRARNMENNLKRADEKLCPAQIPLAS